MNDYHCLNCERRNKKKARRRRMIEKIYKNKYMVVCDNCEDGIELDTWDECMEFMRDNDWKESW